MARKFTRLTRVAMNQLRQALRSLSTASPSRATQRATACSPSTSWWTASESIESSAVSRTAQPALMPKQFIEEAAQRRA